MMRGLKAQMQADAKRVFLSLNDFAVTETVLYWREGSGRPPEERHIPVVTEEEGNWNTTYNKGRSLSTGNDPMIYQQGKIVWIATEDFQPLPRKNRKIQIGNQRWGIVSVSVEDGLLKLELLAGDE